MKSLMPHHPIFKATPPFLQQTQLQIPSVPVASVTAVRPKTAQQVCSYKKLTQILQGKYISIQNKFYNKAKTITKNCQDSSCNSNMRKKQQVIIQSRGSGSSSSNYCNNGNAVSNIFANSFNNYNYASKTSSRKCARNISMDNRKTVTANPINPTSNNITSLNSISINNRQKQKQNNKDISNNMNNNMNNKEKEKICFDFENILDFDKFKIVKQNKILQSPNTVFLRIQPQISGFGYNGYNNGNYQCLLMSYTQRQRERQKQKNKQRQKQKQKQSNFIPYAQQQYEKNLTNSWSNSKTKSISEELINSYPHQTQKKCKVKSSPKINHKLQHFRNTNKSTNKLNCKAKINGKVKNANNIKTVNVKNFHSHSHSRERQQCEEVEVQNGTQTYGERQDQDINSWKNQQQEEDIGFSSLFIKSWGL